MDTALCDKEDLKVTCVPNKQCYALVTRMLTMNGYVADANDRHIDAGFKCKIDVRNTSGNPSASCSYYKLICIFLQSYAVHAMCDALNLSQG